VTDRRELFTAPLGGDVPPVGGSQADLNGRLYDEK